MILGLELVLATLEKAKLDLDQYPEPESIRVAVNAAWAKFNEYYDSKLIKSAWFGKMLIVYRTQRNSDILCCYGSVFGLSVGMV